MVEKQTSQNNWLVAWFTNLRNTKKNIKKVQASPYARLTLALKARKIIIGFLVPWLLWMTYSMVAGIRASGIAGTFQRVIMIGMMAFIIWKIYSTIPQAKKQLEYYKKFPHTINYVPTNVKEDVDSILAKIKSNAEAEAKLKNKPKEAAKQKQDVQEKTDSTSK